MSSRDPQLLDGLAGMAPEQLRSWRAAPWRMFTRCAGCGEIVFCAGNRRSSVRCARCFGRRRSRTSA